MRGKVLGFDHAQGAGVISGDDGNRYSVAKMDLGAGIRTLVPGCTVDFIAQDGRAISVFLLRQGFTRSKWIAAALAFFFGIFGFHKFYLGKKQAGFVVILADLCSLLIPVIAGLIPAVREGFIADAPILIASFIPVVTVFIISLIEVIIYLSKDQQTFYEDYVIGSRNWF